MSGATRDDAPSATLKQSPLADAHRALGAKLVPFGGWEMPLAYPEGTLAEHRACRSGAAVFDVSHLGTVRVEGPGARARLQETLTNDLDRIAPGRAQYTHLLDDDGSVVDDLIVWWRAEEVFDVLPNASNTASVVAALGGVDTTATRALLAVQGPEARRRLAAVSSEAAAVGRFHVGDFAFDGEACVAAGTGYTGEDGVECAVPAQLAGRFFESLLGAGIPPAGLGARDTLRLEAALPLFGHELGPGITPLQAGLAWVVGWDKPDFRGRAALRAERERGPARHLVGLATAGRRPPRDGAAVRVGGREVGHVTSGNFSPMLGHGIALALVATGSAAQPGEAAEVVVRDQVLTAEVVATPFVRAGQFATEGQGT